MKQIGEPLFLAPYLQERPWGGERLGTLLGKRLPPGVKIGESWEVSDHGDRQSKVEGGPFAGRTLHQLLEGFPKALLGEELADRKPSSFPLLAKFIDARWPLSVQVHPDDLGAFVLGKPDRGKAECWVILHADPGSRMLRGLKPGKTPADFRAALATHQVDKVLRSFAVRAGDVIAVPPGMIHSIGAGIVLAEIQQNSDLTFRIHDFPRPDTADGPRPLHIREALETICFDGQFGPYFAGNMNQNILGNALRKTRRFGRLEGLYFDLRVRMAAAGETVRIPERKGPMILMFIRGAGKLQNRPVRAGRSVLLPADAKEVAVTGESAQALAWIESSPAAEK